MKTSRLVAIHGVLVDALPAFAQAQPAIRVQLAEAEGEDQLLAIARAEVDLVVCRRPGAMPQGWEFHALREDRFAVVCRADHPLLRPHPVTGEPALYLTSPARCAAIEGIDDDADKDALVAELLAWSTRAENVYRHAWAPGDVVIWDNGAVLHRADHSGVVGDRVMHRGMVAGYGA